MNLKIKALLSTVAVGAVAVISASIPAEAQQLVDRPVLATPEGIARDGMAYATPLNQSDDDEEEAVVFDEEPTGSIGSTQGFYSTQGFDTAIESFPRETYGRGYNSNGKSYDTYGHIGPVPERDTN